MSTMNMKPQNVILLAAVGIAAYWFITKRSKAATARTPAQYGRVATGGNTQNRPTTPNWTQGLLQGMDAFLNGQQQATQLPGSLDANPTNLPTAYQSSNVDQWANDNGFV